MGIDPISSNSSTQKSVSAEARISDAPASEWQNLKAKNLDDERRRMKVNEKLDYVKNHIAELEAALSAQKLPKDKIAALQKELAEYKELYKKQQELAEITVSADGKTVTVAPKQDVPTEVLKATFYIKDGAFREQLKKDFLAGEDNGVFISYDKSLFGLWVTQKFDYTRSILYNDRKYVIPSSSINPPD